MKFADLLQEIEFDDARPFAKPLYVDEYGRVLLFALKAGQDIREHSTPHSPFYVVILQGAGIFTAEDGQEHHLGSDSLLIFAPNEFHSVRALDEDLVFVGFLHGAPDVRAGKIGGELGREE